MCIGYSDAGVNEAALRLLHFTGGQWEDVTSPGSPDTTNNVICGLTTSFSPFVPAVVLDSDSDGLPDYLEVQQYGTRPDLADTDGDGLTDGTEVNVTSTDPLRPDSDDDGLTDGQEVQLGTNPNNPDTDGDGLSDASDPLPLTPGATSRIHRR